MLVSLSGATVSASAAEMTLPAPAKYRLEEGALTTVELSQVDKVQDIVVGDAAVVDAQWINQRLVLRGLSAGATDILLLFDKQPTQSFEVAVTPRTNNALALQLQELQAQDERLEVTVSPPFSLVSGEVSARTDEQLQRLAANNPELLLMQQVALTEAPMITLSVELVEVKRQWLERLGVDWDRSISGPQYLHQAADAWQLPLSIQAHINLLQQQGHARILAKPRLVTQSGTAASFLAGGEIPIPQVLAQGQQDVTFREYGIRLTMTPELLATGKIATEFSAEVSTLDSAVSVNGIPGILTRRTSSRAIAENLETILVSGLISDDQAHAQAQVPWLGSLPILGSLFTSEDYQRQRTELVIMVTSSVEDPAQRATAKRLQRQLTAFQTNQQCVGLRHD